LIVDPRGLDGSCSGKGIVTVEIEQCEERGAEIPLLLLTKKVNVGNNVEYGSFGPTSVDGFRVGIGEGPSSEPGRE